MKYLVQVEVPINETKVRKLVLEAPDYVILCVLYCLCTPRTENVQRANATVRQFYVLETPRPMVAFEVDENCAYLGFNGLYATARTKFYWPGVYAFLRRQVTAPSDMRDAVTNEVARST